MLEPESLQLVSTWIAGVKVYPLCNENWISCFCCCCTQYWVWGCLGAVWGDCEDIISFLAFCSQDLQAGQGKKEPKGKEVDSMKNHFDEDTLSGRFQVYELHRNMYGKKTDQYSSESETSIGCGEYGWEHGDGFFSCVFRTLLRLLLAHLLSTTF